MLKVALCETCLMDEFVKIGQKLTDGCHGLLRFVIKYGSESKNSDTDYLAVYKNLYRTQSITAGCLDFWAISENSLEKYIQVVDPFVTEPILTGKIVYGDNDEVYSIIERVSSIEITPEAIRHLIARSFKSFDVACNVVPSDSNSDQVSNREYWSGLSYSISYWCFAKAYKKKR